MIAVLRLVGFLLAAGLRNRVRAQLRRARQPRNLVAIAVGLLWWWFYVGRFMGVRGQGLPPELRGAAELAFAGMGLLTLALYWIAGGDRGVVQFSQPEIQLLFPAPLTRRQLLQYRLLRALATSLLAAVFTALLLGRGLSGRPGLFALGSWITFSTLSFHGAGAALTRAALVEHGLSGARRRVLTLGGLAALVALLGWALGTVAPPGPFEPTRAWVEALVARVDGSPLGLVLWPLRAPVRLTLAPDGAAFLAALPGALLVLGAHYAWVISSAVQFEEASVEAAERLARRAEAARRDGLGVAPRRVRRPPFRLGPHGPVEVALLWKGLVAASRSLRAPLLLPAALVAGAAGAAVLRGAGDLRVGLGVAAAALWFLTVVAGPRLLRADLRRDLGNLDALKALPLSGARLLRGALLAPALVLALAQWALLPVVAAGLSGVSERAALPAVAIALGAALLGPVLTLALLVVQNGFAILFPSWAAGADRPRGPEALGLNLLSSLASLLALGLGAIPAGALALAAALAVGALAGPGPAALAGVVTGAIAALVELWAATAFLGRAFERMERSDL